MKPSIHISLHCCLICLQAPCWVHAGHVVYPRVEGEPVSPEYSVEVNGQELPVYTAAVHPNYRNTPLQFDQPYAFANVDCDGSVRVTVRSSVPLSSLSVRGIRDTIPAQLDGTVATFTIEETGPYLIERNGNGRKDPLLLFVNPVEAGRPNPDDANVRYFGPGRHDAGYIELTDNQTLYIDGGAIVRGRVHAKGTNIRILGRGILEHSSTDYSTHMIHLKECRDVRIEGITLRKNSRGWTLVPWLCDGVVLSNVKICGSHSYNDDGIDPMNTRNMRVEGCFIRTNDDCFAFKGKDDEMRNCESITVSNCMFWSDQCCSILLGDESRAAFMRDITIKDCFVPYLSFEGYPKKFLMLHAGDEMRIENILLENIEIRGQGQERNYIEITSEINKYCKNEKPGFIRDVVLRNVHLTGDEGAYRVLIKGYDDTYTVEDVRFENCTVNGQPLSANTERIEIGPFTGGIEFVPSSAK